jgi:hypothetical protein
MIADAVYLAVAGIDFCHAAGRSIISNGLSVRMTSIVPQTRIVPQTWIRQRLRSRRRNCSTPIKNS